MNSNSSNNRVWVYCNGCNATELSWLQESVPNAVRLDSLPEQRPADADGGSLAFLWLGLDDEAGQLQQLERLNTRWPRLSSVVVVPESASEPRVAATLEAGAFECLRQPVDRAHFQRALERGLERAELLAKIDELSRQLEESNQRQQPVDTDEVLTLRELERRAIRRALDKCNGCMSQAARVLGIGRATIYRKMASFQAAGTPV